MATQCWRPFALQTEWAPLSARCPFARGCPVGATWCEPLARVDLTRAAAPPALLVVCASLAARVWCGASPPRRPLPLVFVPAVAAASFLACEPWCRRVASGTGCAPPWGLRAWRGDLVVAGRHLFQVSVERPSFWVHALVRTAGAPFGRAGVLSRFLLGVAGEGG